MTDLLYAPCARIHFSSFFSNTTRLGENLWLVVMFGHSFAHIVSGLDQRVTALLQGKIIVSTIVRR
jgi:hypothetical protein